VQHRRSRHAAGLATLLAHAQGDIAGDWVCCISACDVLYPNHLFAAAAAARRYRARHGGDAPAIVHSGMAQISDGAELPELMNDGYNVTRAEHMRLVQFDFGMNGASGRLPLHPASCLLHVPTLGPALRRRWPLRVGALTLRLGALTRRGSIAFTSAVTLATAEARRYPAYGQFAPP
jgi:hypothetical protein